MSLLFNRLNRWRSRLSFWSIAAVLLLTLRLQAQTIVLTNNSFPSLQNAMAAGGTIILAFSGTVTATSQLFVSSNTVLLAPTANVVTISGGGTTRLFKVPADVSLTLSNLTLSGGNIIGTNGGNGANGGSRNGGTVGTDGGAGSAGGDAAGGAVYNIGTTTAINCIFLTNTATGGNGGNGGAGGAGTFNGGNGGSAGSGGIALGGAIYNAVSGSLVLSNCTLAGNGCLGGKGGTGGAGSNGPAGLQGAGGVGGMAGGGGLYNVGVATILACTFDLNFASAGNTQPAGAPQPNGTGASGQSGPAGRGGGLYNLGFISMVNCTVAQDLTEGGAGGNGGSGDSTVGGTGGNGGNGGLAEGGGFFNDSIGEASLLNCTLASSECFGGTNGVGGSGSPTGDNGSVGRSLGANVFNNGGNFSLQNSILAYPTNAPNVSGVINDFDNNISSDSSAAFTQGNSFNNVNPKLLPLANNGGPTQTMALEGDSVAVNAISDGSAPALDQRGAPRPIGPLPDIGAYEFGALFTVSGKVKSAGGVVAGATLVATGPATITTETDASGNFTLTNMPAGTYTITPQDGAFTFTPSNAMVTLPGQTNAVNFTEIHPAFFNGEIYLGSGFYFLNFVNSVTNNSTNVVTTTNAFGYYSYVSFPVFLHLDLGYEYFFDANDGHGDAYFYDFASQHYFYTGPKLWPYLYDFSLNAWIYYFADPNNPGRYTSNPRVFYNFGTGQFITL